MNKIDISFIAKHLGQAKREGNGWRCCCPAHDDHSPSLSLRWDKRTKTLLAKCWTGCSFESIIKALRQRGLLSAELGTSIGSTIQQRITYKFPQNDYYLKEIWRECFRPEGSAVEMYLSNRGYNGMMPPTLRYHPHLYHQPSKVYYPAMVGAVTIWPSKKLSGIHRTYLNAEGFKASITPNKMMLGNIKGGAIRFSPPEKNLVLAEGIETALSIYAVTGLPTWATLSTVGMINVIVPPLELTQKITIAADNDNAGLSAASALANRLEKQSYQVKIDLPPLNMDFNDFLGGNYDNR